MRDVGIDDVLWREYGLRGEPAKTVRAAMEATELTRPGKTRISIGKLGAIADLIEAQFVRTCHRPACGQQAAEQTGKVRLDVDPRDCEVCGGSVSALASLELREAMGSSGKTRLLVIGGTPNTQAELAKQVGRAGEVRFVSVGETHSGRAAGENQRWADVIVIWASTPIGHKVTTLYKGAKTITVARRGASAVSMGVAWHLINGSA